MKIFAHRGWSTGEGENTLSAFKKSAEANLDGVELDVRFGRANEGVIVVHDYMGQTDLLSLDEALGYLCTTRLELLIEFKGQRIPELYIAVRNLLVKHGLLGVATIFAFPELARMFPWDKPRDVALGIISPYPRNIRNDIEKYNPDMILLGWGNAHERFFFKTIWSILSLARVVKKYPKIKFIVGVAYNSGDVNWLSKQGGLYGATVDKS